MKSLIRVKDYLHTFKADSKMLEAFREGVFIWLDRGFSMRSGVHFTLFYDALRYQGTLEQLQEYEADLLHLRVIGCFGMTELGHSSFLRFLSIQIRIVLLNIINSEV